MPRSRSQGAERQAEARSIRRRDGAGRVGRCGDRAGQGRRQRALPPDHVRGCRRADAAAQERQVAFGRRGRPAQNLDRGRGRLSRALGVRATGATSPASGEESRRGAAIRSTTSSWPGWRPKGLRLRPRPTESTFARRLSLDLIGLPPCARSDRSISWPMPRRMPTTGSSSGSLDSPHYGERWGRIWLDAARYADSDGYEKDKSRQVFAYRDWVIRASTATFLTTSSSSSRSPAISFPARPPDQIVATGFLRNSMINEEGGIDPEQFRMEAMFDRMDCIGKGILGLDDPVRPVPQPQVRPAHAGRVLPDVCLPQQCARGERRGLHSRAREERAEIARKVREIEELLAAPEPRLARADGRLGASGSPAHSPPGRSCGPRSTRNRPAVRSTCCWRTARFWRRDTRRPSTRWRCR